MALLERLGGIGDPETVGKIGINTFHAMLYELSDGVLTKQNIIDYFQLNAGEQTELDYIIGRYNAQPNAAAKAKFVELIRVILILAEQKVDGYLTNADIVARIDAI